MGEIKQYILSVTVAAVVCALVMSICGTKKTENAILRVISGLFLAATVISPWTRVQLDNLHTYFESVGTDASAVAFSGAQLAEDEQKAIIKEQSQAYILDKAKSLGLNVSVEVILQEEAPYVPCAVTICGESAPYARTVLRRYIADAFDVSEDCQKWNAK